MQFLRLLKKNTLKKFWKC